MLFYFQLFYLAKSRDAFNRNRARAAGAFATERWLQRVAAASVVDHPGEDDDSHAAGSGASFIAPSPSLHQFMCTRKYVNSALTPPPHLPPTASPSPPLLLGARVREPHDGSVVPHPRPVVVRPERADDARLRLPRLLSNRV